ncbi:Similar to ATPAF2: ATP synthase mitochondrial F1 complex assembly factor 2 (Homo sapiens) [Cotesia congregata]|uniref:Similar to ATPAF2: ATP synthase mitochondrial F1 complex assembly factor 2 (Homo sapiens) n=1 Tax=Cotesia congregata TaxID=51543 RepID=A0A8J2HGM3_COTCN|nr:Similar to ATPAF2: ATP synthase mitochondrial F1 complex assembly factor 2 (Homo sapiens) [Cotesia congregata]
MFCLKYRQLLPKGIVVRKMATVKRFYRRTNILQSGEKYEITLDQRKLKTPKGRVFEVSSKPLALAVAHEWDSQEDIIHRSNMHMTALCSTFLDNPQNLNSIDIVTYIANYLETDTILYQSSETEELFKIQKEKWDPIIQWFCDKYQVDVEKTTSISSPVIPSDTKEKIVRHVASYNAASLHALNVEEAIALSRLEEEFQISHWGNVEWSHELGKQDLQARLAAAVLFIHLNSSSATTKPKIDST